MFPLKDHIAEVPNFPKEGILFYDISPLLQKHFKETVDAMEQLFSTEEWAHIDTIAGIDSRGFIFASALAERLGKGITLIRKAGKLPTPAACVSYGLEYGKDALEMQAGSGTVLVIDDVLATGGTLKAAAELCEKVGYSVTGTAVLINLPALNTFTWNGNPARAAISY